MIKGYNKTEALKHKKRNANMYRYYKKGYSPYALAKMFAVSRARAYQIINKIETNKGYKKLLGLDLF